MKLALGILIAMEAADAATTAYGLNTGLGREGNPGSLLVLSLGYGVAGLVAAKAFAMACAFALVAFVPTGPARGFLGFMVRATAVYALYVVYSNLRIGGLV